ncbi:tyrosine-type recombinase/integrase [Halostella pelagica]|uniref:tyrosine-type recombinase/integrase n=1 Tax=Halostella pelagica TaxID=2583824 RepID=UPI00192A4D18|nr:site-specific integrase [Halostella pelagica]
MDQLTPDDAVSMYLQDRQANVSDATIRSHRSRLSHFTDWCDGQSDIEYMSDLTARHCHEYRLWRRDHGDPNKVTMKTQMDTFRVLLKWCESRGAVTENLHDAVLSPTLSNGDNARESMLDPEVGDALLEHLNRFEYASRNHVVMLLIWRGLLRRGGVRAIDIDDVELSGDDPRIRIRHRPGTDTPLKNQDDGERTIGIRPGTAQVIEDYIDSVRHDVTGDRDPLVTTAHGRPHAQTLQADAYAVTRPCVGPSGECPHDRDTATCDAATDRQQAYDCPSTRGPHDIRRGAITNWLQADVPAEITGARASTSPGVLEEHYDQRTEREKQRQRRQYLDRV